MDYWRIVALIGTVTFSFSAFLPLISSIISLSLTDFYGLETGLQKTLFGGTWTMPNELAGVFLTMFLYPIRIILGFLTVLKWERILTLVAGSVGIVCWLSALLAVTYFKITYKPSQYSSMIQYGSGIFLGLVGAAIILISFFLKPQEYKAGKQKYVAVPPPPPSPPLTLDRYCTYCGAELSESDVFCRKCGKVVPSRNV